MERRLIEEGRLNYLAPSSVGTSNTRGFRKLTRTALACSLLFACTNAFAIGVGSAEADSYIGEPLSVSIPLFNVDNPNSLSINFESQQFGGEGQAEVSATLDRSNSQLTIKLSSDTVVNEPYVSFKLDLVDSNSEFTKEFTVLMDLRSNSPVDEISQSTLVSQDISDDIVQLNAATSNSDLMGPYDTAQRGRIPSRFGAVLDGQSLWRVARRINEAMGVSRSQMMWALYQANPSAFSGRSVSSLKAGTFLNIPDELTVKSFSDAQAKAELAKLRSGDQTSRDVASVASDSIDQEFDVIGAVDRADTSALESGENSESSFQVTGIDSAVEDQQSQQIIASLTETVGNLSQQLVRKDQKIEFLENQLNELKSFIGAGTNNTEVTVDSPIEVEQANSIAVSGETSDIQVADSNAVLEQAPSQLAPTSDGVSSIQASETWSFSTMPIWQWALLGLLLLFVFIYFLRNRLLSLFRSLNLFDSNDQVEFESVAADASYHDLHEEPKIESPSDEQFGSQGKDYSIITAVEKSMTDQNVLDGISYLDLADDGSYEENTVLEFDTDEASEELEDLSFDERFERLLAERDFEFARELLDFARHNEIDDERYHCERLRLLEKMKDEDGFYEYYYEIEAKIPTFSQGLQTEISQLVVQLAHH